MISTGEPGKITEEIWYLGREESGIYLLEGSSCSMIISGGTSWILPEILEQMKRFKIDESRIKKLLILHAHFDHVGLVPFFKRRLSHLTVYASAAAWRVIDNPEAVQTINTFGRNTAEQWGRADILEAYDLDWRDDVKGIAVADGDRIDCGNQDVQIIAIPGHSSCSIAAYVSDCKALFPSDGGGIPYGDRIIASGNSNYTLFQKNLEKLHKLPVDLIGADHGGYMTGEDARRFIGRTIEAARDFRFLMERVYQRTGSVESTVEHLVDLAVASSPDFYLPYHILWGIYGQMVRHVASHMGEEKSPEPHKNRKI